MPELTTTVVEQYTAGRLHRDDPETKRMLDAGLLAARRRCGWHVTPMITDTGVTIDGPGGVLLRLPTLQLVTLTQITEDGTELAVSSLDVSLAGMIKKKNGGQWTSRFSGVVVKMDHGHEDADDFNAAVLSLIDRASFAPSGGRARVIGPFQYDIEKSAGGWTDQEKAWLEPFILEKPA